MSTAAQRILVRKDRKALEPIGIAAPKSAWRMFGWFGLLLAVVGSVDVALQWYPLAFKSPEWEFGTIAVSIASLPLLTIGVVVLLASFLARGFRPGVVAMSVVFVLLTTAAALALMLFLMDVPLALRAAPAQALIPLKKSIARTLIMGFSFGLAYLTAAFSSFRYLSRRITDG